MKNPDPTQPLPSRDGGRPPEQTSAPLDLGLDTFWTSNGIFTLGWKIEMILIRAYRDSLSSQDARPRCARCGPSPTLKEIAKKLHCSVESVRKALEALVAVKTAGGVGGITITRDTKSNRPGRRFTYEFNPIPRRGPKEGVFWVPLAVWEMELPKTKYTKYALGAFIFLCRCANRNGRVSGISLPRIARALSCCERNVEGGIAMLKEVGAIDITRQQPTESGEGRPNLYQIKPIVGGLICRVRQDSCAGCGSIDLPGANIGSTSSGSTSLEVKKQGPEHFFGTASEESKSTPRTATLEAQLLKLEAARRGEFQYPEAHRQAMAQHFEALLREVGHDMGRPDRFDRFPKLTGLDLGHYGIWWNPRTGRLQLNGGTLKELVAPLQAELPHLDIAGVEIPYLVRWWRLHSPAPHPVELTETIRRRLRYSPAAEWRLYGEAARQAKREQPETAGKETA